MALVETVAELTGVMVVLDQSQQLILFNEQVVVVEVSVPGRRVERVEQVVGATDKTRFLRRELLATIIPEVVVVEVVVPLLMVLAIRLAVLAVLVLSSSNTLTHLLFQTPAVA